MLHYTDGVNSDAAAAGTAGGTGARALAQLAMTDCGALAALRLTKRDPAKIARALYGDDVMDDGSPIALAIGRQLEAALKRDRFSRFRQALHEAGRLEDSAHVRILDVDAAAPGDDIAAQTERVRVTQDALLRALRGDPTVPDVLWHPHLSLTIMPGFRVTIIPDYALLRHTDPGIRVGEIKAYRDRGAYTRISSLRLARLQAAVEVLAMQEAVRALGHRDVDRWVPETVDFMLRSRTGFFGIVRRRPARVHREVDRVRRALTEAPVRLPGIMASLPAGASLDTTQGFEALPYHYGEACRGHCALAQRCAARAAITGQPAILGDDLDAVIGGAVTLTTLDAMLAGLEPPASPEAALVVDAFHQALTALGVTPRPVAEVRRAS